VLVELTPHGEELLRLLSVQHWRELQTSGPALAAALRSLMEDPVYHEVIPEATPAALAQEQQPC
jgi:hypothetical protein